MKVFALLMTVIGIITATLGIVFPILGLVGGFIGIIGAVLQYSASKPKVKMFSEADWIQANGEYVISIPAGRFRGREPVGKVYALSDGKYEVVMCDERELEDGTFEVRVTMPFAGKLVLK
jgi:hypothetical protein